jgi:hypothetical protein
MVAAASVANTSVVLTEIEDDDLSVSVSSPEHDSILEVDLRPTDPVAVTLAAVPSPLPGQKMRIDSKVTATLMNQSAVQGDNDAAVDYFETKRKIGAFSEMKEARKKPKTSTEAQ